jgi:excisionase family DNA binding protein
MDVETLLAAVRQVVREELGVVRPLAVTLKDAARLMGVSSRHVARMVGRGDLLTVEVGGARRVPMTEIMRHTSPLTAPAPSPPKAPPAPKAERYSAAKELEKFRARRR